MCDLTDWPKGIISTSERELKKGRISLPNVAIGNSNLPL